MSTDLNPRQRQQLKRLAHELKPVVQIGAAGVSDAVIAALGDALHRHELIKVKLPKLDDASMREAMAADLSTRSDASLVQILGRVVILYAPRGDDLPGKPQLKLV